MCSMLYTTTGASIVFVLVAEKNSSHIAVSTIIGLGMGCSAQLQLAPEQGLHYDSVLAQCKLLLIAASLY